MGQNTNHGIRPLESDTHTTNTHVTSDFIPISKTIIPIELQNLGWASQVGQQVFSGWVDDQNDKHVQRRVKEIEKYGHLLNLD